MPSLKKETLFSEDHFLHFCNRDDFSGRKLPFEVTANFLRAAEKDELIVPLLIEKVQQQREGVEEEVEIRYYSPFQIFMVVALMHNVINGEGYLCDPDNKEWYEAKGVRYLKWSDGGALLADHYKTKRGEEPEPVGHNAFTTADDFHKILHLIHGLAPEERYELSWNKRRIFTGAPNLAYNYDPIREKSTEYATQYGIDAKKLKRVIVAVGYIASHVDPLERWFDYVRLHAQERRDKLKGMASVSQDLYGFCDIGYDLMDIAFGEKLPPLMELLHVDFTPYMMERPQYAHGEDIKAIQSAFQQLRTWVQENAGLIKDMHPQVEQDKLGKALDVVNERITDYEKRYGDRRYVGSTRTIWPEKKLKLTDLDPETKHWVEQLVKQRTQEKTLTPAELTELTETEITFSIERRLSDLSRGITEIASALVNATWPLEHKAEREKEMVKVPAMADFNKQVKRDDPEYARKHSEFWKTGMKEYEKPAQDRLEYLKKSRAELQGIVHASRIVFCAVCRSKPVRLHHGERDDRVTSEAICEECLTSGKHPTTLGAGEWKCDQCGKMIYKFAHGNVLSDTLRNTSTVTIRLEYGRMEITARCPNKDCHAEQRRAIDGGWVA